MAGIVSISSLLPCHWWSCWRRVSPVYRCSDPSVYFVCSNWPSHGSLSMTSWQSWWILSGHSQIWPSSSVSSSSFSLWWGCSYLERITKPMFVTGTAVPCQDGTSQISCTGITFQLSKNRFYRNFLRQLYDCVSRSLWRVDRVDVGLHICEREGLHPLLHGDCPCRQSCHPKSFPCPSSIEFLRHGWR